jgi:hypothetical protein
VVPRRSLTCSLAVFAGALAGLLAPSTALATITPSGETFDATASQQFSGEVASFTDSTPHTSYTVSIDWGDGSQPTSGTAACRAPCTPGARPPEYAASGSHTYSAAGSYAVTVTITDDVDHDTAEAPSHADVKPAPPPPPVASVAGASTAEGDSGTHGLTFSVSLDHATDHDVSVQWSTGDVTAEGWSLGPQQAQTFADVLPNTAFHDFVEALAGRGVVSGHDCGGPGEPCDAQQRPYFRPLVGYTRGQAAKAVYKTLVEQGIPLIPPAGAAVVFTDLPSTDPFYPAVQFLARRGFVSGYADGTFRPFDHIIRGHLAKLVDLVSGGPGAIPPGTQTFADVPSTHAFYKYIEDLAGRGVVSGYSCGGPGEPCDAQQRPYFRPYANVTRGQAAKTVALALHPGDYTAATGTLVIPAGATSGNVSVGVEGDTVAEPDETLTLTLSSPSGATLGTATATGTITADDTAPPQLVTTDPSAQALAVAAHVSGRPVRTSLSGGHVSVDLGRLPKAPFARDVVVELLPRPRHAVTAARAAALGKVRLHVAAHQGPRLRVPLGRRATRVLRHRRLRARLRLAIPARSQTGRARGTVVLLPAR